MSYHGMGVSPSLKLDPSALNLQVRAPLQVVHLPSEKGSVRVAGPASRRVEKKRGQRTLGVSVPAGTYNVFFRPQGGRYRHLGSVTVPEDGSVTFDAGAGHAPVTDFKQSVTPREKKAEVARGGLVMPGPGSGAQPRDTEGSDESIPPSERRLPPPAAPDGAPSDNGAPPGDGAPRDNGAPSETKAPPEREGFNWVPWAIGAGVVAAVGIGAWWLTQR